jgi:nitrate reductase gamma subunit
MLDTVWFIAFPYVAVILAVGGGLYRYFADRFSYSSFSSQFLENRRLFWGSVPWHYGIILVLSAHLLALIFPGAWGGLLAAPLRLYVLEVTGMALALLSIAGLAWLLVRRLTHARVFVVTTAMDWLVVVALLVQVTLGFGVAFFFRWGSGWYLNTAVPWLVSLALFNPQIQTVAVLPLWIKLHMLGGFFIIAVFPFTRLVHLVTFPVTYLWRPPQVVIWNRRPPAGR